MTVSMVPRDRGTAAPGPQRARDEAAMRDAGLQTKVAQQAPAPPKPAPTTPPSSRNAQGDFDALASRTPTQSGNLIQNPQDSPMLTVMEASPNPQMRDLARRIRGF